MIFGLRKTVKRVSVMLVLQWLMGGTVEDPGEKVMVVKTKRRVIPDQEEKVAHYRLH